MTWRPPRIPPHDPPNNVMAPATDTPRVREGQPYVRGLVGRFDWPEQDGERDADGELTRAEAPNGEPFDVRVVMSDENVAADGGIIRTDGWVLDRFSENPVVLWVHDKRSMPVGRVVHTEVVGDALVGYVQFDPEDGFAQEVRSKMERNFLRAVSVGFLPIEIRHRFRDELTPEEIEAGAFWVSDETELLELSIVPVPSLESALQFDAGGEDRAEDDPADTDTQTDDAVDRDSPEPAGESPESADVEDPDRDAGGEVGDLDRMAALKRMALVAAKARADALETHLSQ